MILVDRRAGSAQLVQHFPKGVAQLDDLEYGDAAFLGDGPAGRTVRIGVEVKQLSDVLKCIVDGRFAGHQLPGLIRTYYSTYLVIEGLFKGDERSGILLQRRGSDWREVKMGNRRFTANDLNHWLMTMEIKAGIKYRHVLSTRQAAMFILSLYKWWNDKGYDGHRSHLALHETEPDVGLIQKASFRRRVFKEFPHIGWQRSKAAESRFGSVKEAVNAGWESWATMPTHTDKNDVTYTLGEKRAKELVASLEEE